MLISLLVANFALAIIESGIKFSELFGEISDFATLGLALGLFLAVIQVGFVLGGIAVAYANAYEKGLFD